MTSIAPDTEQLRKLDAGTREAWSVYNERLRELTGAEYERIEPESWDELQSELRKIEISRESITPHAA